MPLYEYHCGSCGHRFERIQKFSDAPIDTCPSCGAKQVEKLISSPAIQFKGSGWYITDYARSGGSNGSSASSSAKNGDSKASGDSGSSSDSAAQPASTESSSPAKAAV
jgi:putative FmdB family regulatory protein